MKKWFGMMLRRMQYFHGGRGQLLEDFERVKNETIQIGCGSQNVLKLGYLKSYSGGELLNAVLEYNGIYPDMQVHIQNGNHEALYHLLNSNQLDLVLNDQRRAFSNKYVNFHLFEASCYIVAHEKHPMGGNPFFEPQMLNEIK